MATGVERGRRRASGQTAASEEAREVVAAAEEPIEAETLPEERKKQFRTPGFSRMRFDWNDDDRFVLNRAKAAAEGRLEREFLDAYEVMYQVYDAVRTPEVDENGEPKRDPRTRLPIYKRNPDGTYIEDYTKLSSARKEHLLFLVTTHLFDWYQRQADAWGESMLAKAQWEEKFSLDFDAPMAGTVDDRKAKGNVGSTDERYLAIFLTWYSRKADGVVRALELLGQRLKDTLPS
jgi:hypothetical protein